MAGVSSLVSKHRLAVLIASVAVVGVCAGSAAGVPRAAVGNDWMRFGWSAARSSAPTFATGITAANVRSLKRQQIQLDGTADSSPIYLHGVQVAGGTHDVFFVTTTYGKTVAIDAVNGDVLWRFTPPGYSSWAGSAQITTATPVADPGRTAIYAASPGGQIHKLAIADGHPLWNATITKLPSREKIASPLNYANGRLIATTGGYIGDAPPYQGHVAMLDPATGQVAPRLELPLQRPPCAHRPCELPCERLGDLGAAGAVVDPVDRRLLVATGNATWDGHTNWGDALLVLNPSATKLIGNYTPTNTADLNAGDVDLGSTSPVMLGPGFVAQGGKDGIIRLLEPQATCRAPLAHKGGELQTVPTPSGTELFTAPAVWHATATWMFAGDNGGTAAYVFKNGRLRIAWRNRTGGTSPVVAGGLL